MAKAASASKMNNLHDMVADVFLVVLKRYKARMDAQDAMVSGEIDMAAIEEDMLKELFDESTMPSASMMAAITKFLKDNEVLFEKDITDEISDHQRILEERRRNRPSLSDLTIVPAAGSA